MPTVIISKEEIEELIKEKYKVDEVEWKIVKKDVSVKFKQELTVTIVDGMKEIKEREELKREIKKNVPDGVMTGGERNLSGRF